MKYNTIIKGVAVAGLSVLMAACATPSAQLANHPSMPNQSFFYNLKQEQSPIKVGLTSDKSQYILDDTMRFQVNSNIDGRVWLIQVDANDEVSILYPYKATQINQIKKNQPRVLADPHLSDEFYAAAPTGISSVMAVVAPAHKNLHEIMIINNNRIEKVAFEQDKDWGFARVDVTIRAK